MSSWRWKINCCMSCLFWGSGSLWYFLFSKCRLAEHQITNIYTFPPSLFLSHSKMQSQCCISELKKAQQSDCCCQSNYFPSAHQVSSTFWRSPDKVEEPSICWWYALHDKGSAIKMWIKVEVKSARDKLCKVAGGWNGPTDENLTPPGATK